MLKRFHALKNNKINVLVLLSLSLSSASSLLAQPSPLGTHFTYQGYLEDGNQPADGVYHLHFRLYDGASPTTSTLLDSARL